MLRIALLVLFTTTLAACGGGSSSDEPTASTTPTNGGNDSEETSYVKQKEAEGYLCNTTQDICYQLAVTEEESLSGTREQCTISTEACSSSSLSEYISTTQESYVSSVASMSGASLSQCDIEAGVYTCSYNKNDSIYSVTSTLSYDNSSYSVVHSYDELSWTDQKENEGFNCGATECVKVTTEGSQYNGTIETCLISDRSCSSAKIYEVASETIQRYSELDYIVNTVGTTQEQSCSFIQPSYFACIYANEQGEKTRFFIDLSGLSNNSPTLTASFELKKLSSIEFLLNEEFSPNSFYPAIGIAKPSSWLSDIPELQSVLDSEDDWDKGNPYHTFMYSATRSPICSDNSDGYTFSCVFTMEYGEYHQCDYSYLPIDRVCNVYSSIPPKVTDQLKHQLELNGFDSATEESFDYSTDYTVISEDEVCEPDHELISGKVVGLRYYFDQDRYYELDITSQQDKNLMRWKQGVEWSGLMNGAHCAGVTSIITSINGAPIKILSGGGDFEELPNQIPNGSLLGVSQIANYRTATHEFVSDRYFSVWGAGNSGQNYSQVIIDRPTVDYVWDDPEAANTLFVGAVDADGVFKDTYAYPGDNPAVQARWIMALGVDVWKATTTVFGNAAVSRESGTSFAQPFVTRAMAKAKNICPSSSYSALSNVLLETANRDFDGYDPSKYGQGLLDVNMLVNTLKNGCP
ncbi:S8 family serine peptidase [Marinomonas balearica]|uniref:Subtilase family protein n=1 Tax=Marinomonas balearica TaxID=491947 RepID=A0A4R6MCG2_9GAMM|nr:S8 family serine peptidase [Marinomonas balearica]TDO97939.1 subtilase family protein [Marinomonas balearica]